MLPLERGQPPSQVDELEFVQEYLYERRQKDADGHLRVVYKMLYPDDKHLTNYAAFKNSDPMEFSPNTLARIDQRFIFLTVKDIEQKFQETTEEPWKICSYVWDFFDGPFLKFQEAIKRLIDKHKKIVYALWNDAFFNNNYDLPCAIIWLLENGLEEQIPEQALVLYFELGFIKQLNMEDFKAYCAKWNNSMIHKRSKTVFDQYKEVSSKRADEIKAPLAGMTTVGGGSVAEKKKISPFEQYKIVKALLQGVNEDDKKKDKMAGLTSNDTESSQVVPSVEEKFVEDSNWTIGEPSTSSGITRTEPQVLAPRKGSHSVSVKLARIQREAVQEDEIVVVKKRRHTSEASSRKSCKKPVYQRSLSYPNKKVMKIDNNMTKVWPAGWERIDTSQNVKFLIDNFREIRAIDKIHFADSFRTAINPSVLRTEQNDLQATENPRELTYYIKLIISTKGNSSNLAIFISHNFPRLKYIPGFKFNWASYTCKNPYSFACAECKLPIQIFVRGNEVFLRTSQPDRRHQEACVKNLNDVFHQDLSYMAKERLQMIDANTSIEERRRLNSVTMQDLKALLTNGVQYFEGEGITGFANDHASADGQRLRRCARNLLNDEETAMTSPQRKTSFRVYMEDRSYSHDPQPGPSNA